MVELENNVNLNNAPGQQKLSADVNLPDDDVLDLPTAVAKELKITTGGLARLRYEGRGPEFVMLSLRRVAYRRGAWRRWLRERTFRATSEAVAAVKEQQASTNTSI
jgi:hypothetical protein